MNNATPGHTSLRGFTIVELLVVIGIIGLLIGILLPVLSAARTAAKSAHCASNLRQIGIAAFAHANDHQGRVPLAGIAEIKSVPDGSPGSLPRLLHDGGKERYAYTRSRGFFIPFPEQLAPFPIALLSYLEDAGYADTEISPLDVPSLDEQFKSLEIFQCPDSRADYTLTTSVAWETNGNGPNVQSIETTTNRWDYGVNVGVAGFHWSTRQGRAGGLLSAIEGPSQVALLIGLDRTIYSRTRSSHAYWQPIAGALEKPVTLTDAANGSPKVTSKAQLDPHRHNGKTGVLFVDGHAEIIPVEQGSTDRVILRR